MIAIITIWWVICLAVYLILDGLHRLAGLNFRGLNETMGALAILAGIFLLVGW